MRGNPISDFIDSLFLFALACAAGFIGYVFGGETWGWLCGIAFVVGWILLNDYASWK